MRTNFVPTTASMLAIAIEKLQYETDKEERRVTLAVFESLMDDLSGELAKCTPEEQQLYAMGMAFHAELTGQDFHYSFDPNQFFALFTKIQAGVTVPHAEKTWMTLTDFRDCFQISDRQYEKIRKAIRRNRTKHAADMFDDDEVELIRLSRLIEYAR